MDSHDIQLNNSGKRLSFYQLFKTLDLQIQIPRIQRDYAQGRAGENEVRTTFLNALYGYLQNKVPFRDLDFVYGTILEGAENKYVTSISKAKSRFVPLDGQQRLTTLFLLHWYLAQISGEADSLREVLCVNGHSLFSYETRDSSKMFCDALMANNIDFDHLLSDEKQVESVSATIKDRGWFFLSWADDPTIRSMLIMLDAIHIRFKGCSQFYQMLIALEEPVITFLFLDLKEFNLTDDLYIKMNSRGKPLSNFENFKAQYERSISHYWGDWPEYRLKFRKDPVSGYEYFVHKIDIDWADLFWTYRNEASSDNTFDDELINFIALVFANYEILRTDLNSENVRRSLERLFGAGGKLNRLSFMEYDSLGSLSKDQLINLIEIFDLISHEKGIDGKLKPYLSENKYYAEERNFRNVITNNTTYSEKLRFYAFYAGLANGLSGETLISWIRVIFNLTENTIINIADQYQGALRSISELLMKDVLILELLRQDIQVSGFTEAQVTEEKIKAHLMDKSSEWKDEIVTIENHPFFRGQIGFILKFSGIFDYYRENKNLNWDDSKNEYFINFKRYSESACAVFDCIEQDSKGINYAWERAVLTKGEYFTSASANRFNLLSARVNKNNIERDHSWKRLLRVTSNQDDSFSLRQSYVKAVFDDINFDIKDVQNSLETICAKALLDSSFHDWRRLLVSNPDLFNLSQQGFIVKNDREIVLLHESQRNHYHSEIYSKYLHLELIDRNVDCAPFSHVKYEPARSGDDFTFITITGFSYLNLQYSIDIMYQSNSYLLLFYNKNKEPCHICFESILNDCKYSRIQDWDDDMVERLSEYQNGYISQCETVDQAMDNLKNLCAKISNHSGHVS